jgi:molecular chaperone GrpE (heat shock protein)
MAGKTTPAVIVQELVQLRTMLQKIEQQESASKQAFNTLYVELEQYKKDFVFQLEKSLLIDLLLFYDSLIWFQSSIASDDSDTHQNLSYLIDEYLEVLQRRDVYPFHNYDTFDPKYHRIIQNNDVYEAELDQKIHRVLKRGFHRGERVLRVEEVIVNRFVSDNPPVEDSDPIEDSDNNSIPVNESDSSSSVLDTSDET